ncbi:UDP-glucuronate 4-epimerase 2-like isoform X2 [Pistacia vera]|uniref:UDP-glucuronate 4-epimerase 2-like isoform X2 n=1 Tax=Pistacia vera TaxID=55513 RepID=UPI0012631EF3|nr:UDP-glucuronate 4-epimerase 2-like isoform X2 [Pistacia vera]
MDKPLYIHRFRYHFSITKLLFWSLLFLSLIYFFFYHPPSSSDSSRRRLWGGADWEYRVLHSARPRSRAGGRVVLVTGAAGFIGTHVSAALRRRGDGVVGLDNFNDYYDTSLKRGRASLLERAGLRFFTVYGPWGRPDMAYFFFTRNILKRKNVVIFEGPDHSTVARDFTYIDDIVKGCLAALDTAKKSTGSGGKKRGPAQLRVFNLGNTTPEPVGKLVSTLEKLLKVKAKKIVLPMPANGDVLFTHANVSLAQRELGYKPKTDLQAGLKKFVRWYLDYYSPSGKKSAV